VLWVQSRYWTRQQRVSVLGGREPLILPRGAALRPTVGSPEMALSDPYAKAIRDRAARLADDWGELTRSQGAFAFNLTGAALPGEAADGRDRPKIFLIQTKLPISWKTKGRGERVRETNLPFGRAQQEGMGGGVAAG
jgi:hypothetical protein